MLRPVSILALDAPAASIAVAVQKRLCDSLGLEELVQMRALFGDGAPHNGTRLPSLPELADAIESIHERRQAPDSAIRGRNDVTNRELILLAVSAAGPARTIVIELANQLRQLYQMRMSREAYTIEVLCLLPDLFTSTTAEDYGSAYSLLKLASAAMLAEGAKPFDAMWLVSSTNANRVKFGRVEQSPEPYVAAVAGALSLEQEVSGSMSGAFRPRGMDATFSAFGYAELVFPRDVAAQRIEARLAAELVRDKLLNSDTTTSPTLSQLWAKEFVAHEKVVRGLEQIGVESGQSLWIAFRAKTTITEKTRSADEVIAAVASEAKAHRDMQQVKALQALALQGDQTAGSIVALLSDKVDEKLDQKDYHAGIRCLEALLDPTPELHAYADPGLQNLPTKLHRANQTLDQRLRFTPDEKESQAIHKRIRDLDGLLASQKVAADVLTPLEVDDGEVDETRERAEEAARQRAEELAAMQRERNELLLKLHDVIFREDKENNSARNTARDAEAQRLAKMTEEREDALRALWAERPKAEMAWHEAILERNRFLKQHALRVVFVLAAIFIIPSIGRLLDIPLLLNIYQWGVDHIDRVAIAVGGGLLLYGIYVLIRYLADVAPAITKARNWLERLDRDTNVVALNEAHNEQLRFEYEVAQRRTTINVLNRTRVAARKILGELRARTKDMFALAGQFSDRQQAASITAGGLSVSIIDDDDVDRWYERTKGDRAPALRDFFVSCMTRSGSRHVSMDELQNRIGEYASRACELFRQVTLAQVVTGRESIATEAEIAHRLKLLADFSAPLIEVRDDDIPSQQSTQRGTTLWLDENNAPLVAMLRKRFPHGQIRAPRDDLRLHVLSRLLYFPAYVIGQIEYYRAQYDATRHLESADVPDLLPTEVVLSGAMREAYEQILLARAMGSIRIRDDGQLGRTIGDVALGDTNLAAARRLASSESAPLRMELEAETETWLERREDVEQGLRGLLTTIDPLTTFDRNIIGALIRRYGTTG